VIPLGGREQGVDPKLSTSFIALLKFELSGQPNLKLVERQLRDRLLKEQRLSLAALADARAPLRVGRLLGADLIVWGQPARAGTSPALLMRVVEAKTGVVRGVSSVPMNAAALVAASGELAKRGGAVASSDKPPVATVAIGLFESARRFERLRPLAFLLRDRMTEELERRASLLVVQRSSMQRLVEELDLLRSRAAADGAGTRATALPPWIACALPRPPRPADRCPASGATVRGAGGPPGYGRPMGDERPILGYHPPQRRCRPCHRYRFWGRSSWRWRSARRRGRPHSKGPMLRPAVGMPRTPRSRSWPISPRLHCRRSTSPPWRTPCTRRT
jgi:hypothetical protein